ncbi:MAG TPA: hypothetical protein DIC64_00580 [Alphaproteobacteria bacterium]|nr:hypothetical protein [Alphaproteobacteria bacterium]
MVKTASLENVNAIVLNEKLGDFIAQNGTKAVSNCRLVRMSLSEKVHHFPQNIPFIAAVRECEGGKQAVFFIKRKKYALVEGAAVSSSKNVGESFEIDNVKYILEDTMNDMPRYKPVYPKPRTRKAVKVEE